MRCCAPFCENTSETASASEEQRAGISFHEFPSEEHLRAAWLIALDKPEAPLPELAVVCSQHFLSGDFYKTESGLMQIVPGAIPSTLQICMLCLDTDSQLSLMDKHRLEEAYKQLTGYPLRDTRNLKHTVCAECAQRLMNFSRFRDKSLRARALLMDLAEKHELITRKHIKLINRTKHQLKSSMVSTTLAPDHCDLHIVEHPSQHSLRASQEAGDGATVKTEDTDDSVLDDEDQVMSENYYNYDQDPLKYDNAPFQCTLCLEEFVHEHEYTRHMSVHHQLQSGDDGECEPRATATSARPGTSLGADDRQRAPQPSGESSLSAHSTRNSAAEGGADSVHRSQLVQEIFNCESYDQTSTDCSYQPTFQSSETLKKDVTQAQPALICDSCRKTFKQKSLLVKHIESHAEVNQFTCNVCQYSCKYKSLLVIHTRTHTGEKPYSCKLCEFKCSRRSGLVYHMRTHTGEKPFTCKLCEYKCSRKNKLVYHIRTHTDEKPFSCKMCDYKSVSKFQLSNHMRTHRGEKPLSCEVCDYKNFSKSHLTSHMKTHTGERPFSCNLCDHKSVSKSQLTRHMRRHTGEKPFSCKLCGYKSGFKFQITRHMKTHTGEKPYCCMLCEFKCSQKYKLVYHMRKHSGEKPFSCELCEFKCSHRSNLVYHMKTHMGEKPFTCKLCDYKSIAKSHLSSHMKTHTGEKPFSCKLCDYKSIAKSQLTTHMRSHTGEKPYSCK